MLRYGYTTGTCAALAAAAAARLLLSEKAPQTVCLMTAKGLPVEVELTEYGMDGQAAWAGIPKDAGDDADVTDGMLICARVSKASAPGIHIDGGEGVGRVTKPGLDQPVGNAAINSGPRQMIKDAVQTVCSELGCPAGLDVLIYVPDGREAAQKTFNPNLGIIGGISILGTTGIVEPMSEQALVDTIEVELNQIALESDKLIITPGNYGSSFIEARNLDDLNVPVLKFSNFLGETLDMIAGSSIDTVLLVAHVGKLSKVAAGIMNTHSKYADGRNEIFCAHAAICGAGRSLCEELMNAATTDAAIELLDGADLRDPVIRSMLTAIQKKLERRAAGNFRIGALMFSNVYGLLGTTDTADEILHEWEDKE